MDLDPYFRKNWIRIQKMDADPKLHCGGKSINHPRAQFSIIKLSKMEFVPRIRVIGRERVREREVEKEQERLKCICAKR